MTTAGRRASVTVADHLDKETAYDVVFVTVNAHQVADLISTLQVSKAKAIQFMFVTTEAARLRAAVGETVDLWVRRCPGHHRQRRPA